MFVLTENVAVTSSGDTVLPLQCPGCGGEYLHHTAVTVFGRCEDAETTTVTEVNRGDNVIQRTLPSVLATNPSSRRGGLAVRFLCETCHLLPELTIEQHKGCSYLAWRVAGVRSQWGDDETSLRQIQQAGEP